MCRVAAFLFMIARVGGPLKNVRSPRVILNVRRRVFIAKCELLNLGSPTRRSILRAKLVRRVVVLFTSAIRMLP